MGGDLAGLGDGPPKNVRWGRPMFMPQNIWRKIFVMVNFDILPTTYRSYLLGFFLLYFRHYKYVHRSKERKKVIKNLDGKI